MNFKYTPLMKRSIRCTGASLFGHPEVMLPGYMKAPEFAVARELAAEWAEHAVRRKTKKNKELVKELVTRFWTVVDQVLVDRLSGRRVYLKCGATYHISMLNGETKCAKCGDDLVQRNDDKAETVLSRLEVYHAQTAPLIGYYEKKGLLKVIAGDQNIDGIFTAIMNALGAKA